jgi:gamma-glutamylcyclotransferase (GGCT)/AIG2-like uncharacterized protein YtfP
MPFYFAYGSNMDVAAMRRRCRSSLLCGTAELCQHRFFIMCGGYASIAPDPNQSVHGLLWQLAGSDIAALDRYEEVASGLYRKRVVTILFRGGYRRALIYWGRSTLPGAPRPMYMEAILTAAATAELPSRYLAFLARLWRNGRDQARPPGLRSSGIR